MSDAMILGLMTLGFSVISVTVAATWYLGRAIGKAYGHAELQVKEHTKRCRHYAPGPDYGHGLAKKETP